MVDNSGEAKALGGIQVGDTLIVPVERRIAYGFAGGDPLGVYEYEVIRTGRTLAYVKKLGTEHGFYIGTGLSRSTHAIVRAYTVEGWADELRAREERGLIAKVRPVNDSSQWLG